MSSAERLNPITVEDYLEGERLARIKHEFVAGKVYAMAGGTYAHNLIATNVLVELHAQLKGKPCRALNSDSKVKIQPTPRRGSIIRMLRLCVGKTCWMDCIRTSQR